MRKINPILLFIAWLIAIFSARDLYAGETGSSYFAGEAGARYNAAIKCINAKQPDFAFMEFRSIVRDFPESPLAHKAIFALAEYCYDHGMYYDAINNFTLCAEDDSDPKAGVIAKAYLCLLYTSPSPRDS